MEDSGRKPAQNRRKPRSPALSPRLQMVAELLPSGRRLIDIGTDHAYLPIHAVLDGRFSEAVAADIREGPLAKAGRNIERFGCVGQVRVALSDGLQHFSLKSGDVVAMAGMGGLEMIDILCDASDNWPSLVMQPQKSAPELRRHLAHSGYVIRAESLCRDDGRLYLGILAEYAPDESAAAPVDPADFYIGPALRRDRPPLFEDYLLSQRGQVARAMQRHPLLSEVQQTIDQLLATIRTRSVPDRAPGQESGGAHAAF